MHYWLLQSVHEQRIIHWVLNANLFYLLLWSIYVTIWTLLNSPLNTNIACKKWL